MVPIDATSSFNTLLFHVLILTENRRGLNLRRVNCGLVHPYVPCDWPGDVVGHRQARDLEGQLYLAMVVALVPDHVLEKEDRVVVMKVHLLARFEPAPDSFADCNGAFAQHLRDAV